MLRLNHVRKTFGAVVAVDDLSLEIERGELFGLLGPNGAGKTTTIRMAIGQLPPDRGSVDVNGAGPPVRAQVRQRIGIAPQALAIYEELTGEQNLQFFGRLYGLRGRALRQRVDTVLDLVGLADRRGDRAKTYSGGMQRRLNLAAALVHEPDILLLDEPTVGVDPQSRNAIFEFVQQLNAAGCTVLYTTHYMEEAQRLCSRVGIVDHGKLLALDTVDGLIRQHGRASVVVVERAAGDEHIETEDPKAELLRVLNDPEVRGVRVDRPNLESVFLSLTGRSLRD